MRTTLTLDDDLAWLLKRRARELVGILVHAHNAEPAVHESARLWWEGCLEVTESVGLARATVLGFQKTKLTE
jgi:hypothetical protein